MSQHLKLVRRDEIARETMAFWFDIKGKNYVFEAGQHATFTLLNPAYTDEEGNSRTFSFASSPTNQQELMIATRMRDTAFKKSLKELPLGSEVEVSEPSGNFLLPEDTSVPVVFLTGGIGVVPARSIIEYATERNLAHQIYLFYSNHTRQDTPFLDDFEKYKQANPNFVYIPTITKPEESEGEWQYEKGRIDRNLLHKYLGNLGSAWYFVSGPHGMVVAMYRLLTDNNVSRDNIKTEEFVGY